MKKYLWSGVIFVFLLFTPLSAFSGWVLYDNFNSGAINPKLWSTIGHSATITVENGKAKFEHEAGHPNESAWLKIKKSPKSIKGIRASVYVKSCVGDVRARMGGYTGTMGKNISIWNQLAVQAGQNRIPAGVWLEKFIPGPPVERKPVGSKFYCQFTDPDPDNDLLGKWFVLTMTFKKDSVVYTVNRGFGTASYKVPSSIKTKLPIDIFMGIGTRSENGDGPCIAYFDNVYVLH